MGQQIIDVKRKDTDPAVLELTPETLDLQDGDWVEWKFWGLNEGEFGFISFKDTAPKFGPFYSLRSNGNDSFLGKGNKGEGEKEFAYVALILNLKNENPAASGNGTIRNHVSHQDITPYIKVTYKPDAITPLSIDPFTVCLNVGDTAIWRFQSEIPNVFLCFKFDSATAASVDGASGPFVAFSAFDIGQETIATGMGFVAAIPPYRWSKTYQYTLQVRSWDGKLLASHDPVIDNLGPPAPG